MFEVGPFPRENLRVRVLPQDVFRQGIPGQQNERDWLTYAGIKSTGVTVPTTDVRFTIGEGPGAGNQAINYCVDTGPDDEDVGFTAIEGTSYEGFVWLHRLQVECTTLTSDGSIKEQQDYAVEVVLNRDLTLAVAALVDVVITPGADAVISTALAEGALVTATQRRGMLGVPTSFPFLLGDSIAETEGSERGVETLLGNRLWVHDNTDRIFVTSDVFYDFVVDNVDWADIGRNRKMWYADLYASIAIGDYAGSVNLP